MLQYELVDIKDNGLHSNLMAYLSQLFFVCQLQIRDSPYYCNTHYFMISTTNTFAHGHDSLLCIGGKGMIHIVQ